MMIAEDLNYYFVGVMAKDEDTQHYIGKQSIFFSKDTLETIFFVKRLSEGPRDFPRDVKIFSSYGKYFEKFGFDEQWNLSDEDRKIAARAFFEEYLILFKPYERYKNNEYALNIDSVDIVKKPFHYDDTQEILYYPIPKFSPQNGVNDFASFIANIRQERAVGKIEGISHAEADTPQFLLWYDTANQDYQIVGGITEHSYSRYEGYKFRARNLTAVPFEEPWIDFCLFKDDVIFIPENIVHVILHALNDACAVALPAGPSDLAPLRQMDNPGDAEEAAFLEALTEKTQSRGFLYHPVDLVNFHVAMKSSNLVILSGMSGTGKSRLVELYAHAIGAELTFIPVRPSWSDDADLLGFVDTVHNIYRPGDSMLVDTLIEAAERTDKLYIVCFDEMNLARAEHYFSQLFSVLENDMTSRSLKLYNKDIESRLYNHEKYPPQIPIRNNIFFVGTVNIDESTHHFSDKVLDRANVIALEMLPFSTLKKVLNDDSVRQSSEKISVNFDNFRKPANAIILSDREIDFLQALYGLFEDSMGQGFGYRIVRQVNGYLSLLPQNRFLSRQDAFDLQVLQRIFTKIRGSEETLRALIGKYDPSAAKVENSGLFELMDNYIDVSAFTRCRKQILLKAKELRANGYTL